MSEMCPAKFRALLRMSGSNANATPERRHPPDRHSANMPLGRRISGGAESVHQTNRLFVCIAPHGIDTSQIPFRTLETEMGFVPQLREHRRVVKAIQKIITSGHTRTICHMETRSQ